MEADFLPTKAMSLLHKPAHSAPTGPRLGESADNRVVPRDKAPSRGHQKRTKEILMAMVGTLTASEEAQLQQTIEMFEVITQSQPQDYQSLEILKEAY